MYNINDITTLTTLKRQVVMIFMNNIYGITTLTTFRPFFEFRY